MDRRAVIADAAIAVVADEGLRALTHRGIDAAAGLPAGSTSYYFRTRSELLTAIVDRVTESSRAAFERVTSRSDESVFDESVVEVSVQYLAHLLSERPKQLRARHSLLIDAGIGLEEHVKLGQCLFSLDRATELFGDRLLAAGFVALCEGLVVTGLEAGTTSEALRVPIVTYLRGARKS